MTLWIYTFFYDATATTEIYTLSLHDALPIYLYGQFDVQLTALDVALQRTAVHELHDHVVLHAAGAVLVGAHDVGVVEALRHFGLAVEAPDELGVRNVLFHGDLQSHHGAVRQSPGAEDAGHPARTDLLQQLVTRYVSHVEVGDAGALDALQLGRGALALAPGRRHPGTARGPDGTGHEELQAQQRQ